MFFAFYTFFFALLYVPSLIFCVSLDPAGWIKANISAEIGQWHSVTVSLSTKALIK